MTDAVHPCPACDEPVDVTTALDEGACPSCGTARTVLYALADGIVSVDDCEPRYEGSDALVIPAEVGRETREQVRDLPDPADEEREAVYA